MLNNITIRYSQVYGFCNHIPCKIKVCTFSWIQIRELNKTNYTYGQIRLSNLWKPQNNFWARNTCIQQPRYRKQTRQAPNGPVWVKICLRLALLVCGSTRIRRSMGRIPEIATFLFTYICTFVTVLIKTYCICIVCYFGIRWK